MCRAFKETRVTGGSRCLTSQYTQRCPACFFVLLTSTTSRVESTPTAPPQKEATMGSTSASWEGRCIDAINCSYVVPACKQFIHL